MLRENNDLVIFGLNDQEYQNNNYKKRMIVLKKFIQLSYFVSFRHGLYIHCHLLVSEFLGKVTASCLLLETFLTQPQFKVSCE